MDIPAGEVQKLQKLRERVDLVLDHTLRGIGISEIARERNTSRPTVRKWIKLFEAQGQRGLLDRPLPGRSRVIPQWVRDEVVRLTLETRPPNDLGEDRRWTTRLLGELFDVSPSHIANIWREAGIDPRQHLQQVVKNPFRPVPLRVEFDVPAWVKLNLELTLRQRDWTLRQYMLARLVDVDPDQLTAGLEERWEEVFETLRDLWSEAVSRLPVEDPRSPEYRHELKQRIQSEG